MQLRFNPCFNGSMYKNGLWCGCNPHFQSVSILVLMDLCIKTLHWGTHIYCHICFNPCFNGSMYKNNLCLHYYRPLLNRFNPCFNGSMYKNKPISLFLFS